MANQTPGKVIDDVTCYTDNVSELLKEFRSQFTLPETGEFKPEIGFQEIVQGVNTLVAKIKEAALECEGTELTIPRPEGNLGAVLAMVLQAVGLDIFD